MTVLIGVAFIALAAVLLLIGVGGLAFGALALGLFVAATGHWISGGHIRDFQGELRALDARRRAEP